MLWPTIDTHLLAFGTNFESEFGGDHHSLAHRSQRFADEFFVGERAVNFGRVEKGDATFHRCADKRNHLLLILRRPVAKTHPHTAQPDRRDFQATLSKFALLHRYSLNCSTNVILSEAKNLGSLVHRVPGSKDRDVSLRST